MQLPAPIRRVVTGVDKDGKSFFVDDGPSPSQRVVPQRPGYRVTNLWCTERGQRVDAPDRIAQHSGVEPPPGGTVIRVIEWPTEPTDPLELRQMLDATFAQNFADAHRDVRPNEHPSMHTTETVDYAIVLEGEVYAILEREERLLKAGDVLIQRGTRHGWSNRSGKSVKVAFVLVSAHG